MGFSTNYEDVQDFDIIPKGEYEVIITKIEERTTKNGATGLNFTLVIRNDVEQNCKNRRIFHTFWKRREPNQADLSVNGYGFYQIMQMAKAVRLPAGKNYKTIYNLLDELSGKIMRVTVGHREYNGRTYEEVRYMNVSDFPECRHIFRNANSGNITDYEEILSDSDLPF